MRRDDFDAYLYKTTDHGKTWTSIVNNLPAEPINVIREDHNNPNLLFVGTDFGVYASIDGGSNWAKFMNGMPTNPAYDMVIHPRENELVVATHGRGIFIADIKPLQGMTSEVMNAGLVMHDIQPAVQYVAGLSNNTAYTNFRGESRSPGSHLFFNAKSAGKAMIKVYRGAREIYHMEMDAEAGLNHALWRFVEITGERTERQLENIAGRYRRFGMSDADIEEAMKSMKYITSGVGPGTYQVVVEMNGMSSASEAKVMKDYWVK